MKNIHILPTDKPSRLLYLGTSKELTLLSLALTFRTFERSTQHIYITSDEEIKEGNWCYNSINNNVYKKEIDKLSFAYEYKIILTTDQDLINNGVQKIADDFLEWFIKNPSCEEVPVGIWSNLAKDGYLYHIIIPKEERERGITITHVGKPKQETLEEAMNENGYHDQANDTLWREGVLFGAKWQQEQILEFLYLEITERRDYSASKMCEEVIKFIEQFKKK